MTTAINLRGATIFVEAKDNRLTLDVGGGPQSYPLPVKFQVHTLPGDLMLLILPTEMPPPPQQPAPPLPPPTQPSGDYFTQDITFRADNQFINPFPSERIAALRITVPADARVGAAGSIRLSEWTTGPMKRQAFLNQTAGSMSGMEKTGTTLEFIYVVGRPATQWQARFDPGKTYYINVQTTKPLANNCPMVVTAIPPK